MRALLSLVWVLAACAVAAEELPYASFGHLPIIQQPRISPNGQYVASILNGEDGPTICVSDFGSSELNAIVRLKNSDDRIEWIEWANDDRLLISISETDDVPGRTFRVRRLYQVGRNGKGMRQIRRKRSRQVPQRVSYLSNDGVLSLLPNEPDHILMQVYDERDEGFTPFKVDITKNRFEKLFINEYDVDQWHTDNLGNVVLGIGTDEDERTVWYRPEGEKKWQQLHKRKAFEGETFSPMLIVGDKAMVISNYDLGRQALWQYDIPSGEFEEVVFAADGHDLDGVILSTDWTELLGVYYHDNYRVEHYFDANARQAAALIERSFPGFEPSIASRSQDGKRVMVSVGRDNAAAKLVWLDLATGAGSAWFATYPYLEGKELSPVTPIEFEARDGTTIGGYLTMPTAAGADKPSLVVLPHGGPHSRDYQYFDPFVQFFANRGHAVLQVNFRGSEGFGTEFETAGYRQWGMAMQDDVYDAIEWLAGQGTVDADRKCIVGLSYGGYVSLTAAFQRPDEFRCVASIAGIADLHEMAHLDSLNPFRKLAVAKMIGDPRDSDDKAMLEANSAINHVNKIEAPLLIVHGTEDTRVRVAQSRAFHRAAKAAGLDIEYVEIEDGTHFLDGYNNRLAVFAALDRFLKQHL